MSWFLNHEITNENKHIGMNKIGQWFFIRHQSMDGKEQEYCIVVLYGCCLLSKLQNQILKKEDWNKLSLLFNLKLRC